MAQTLLWYLTSEYRIAGQMNKSAEVNARTLNPQRGYVAVEN